MVRSVGARVDIESVMGLLGPNRTSAMRNWLVRGISDTAAPGGCDCHRR